MNKSFRKNKISKHIDPVKKRYDAIILFFINTMLIIVILFRTNTFYVIPYRDMIIGLYPPSRIIDLFLSPWTPENFGMLSSLPPSHIFMYLLEILLPPIKAFAIYTITPIVITSVIAYYSLGHLLIIKDKIIKLLLTFLYTYNWLTIYLYGATLVIYAYAGGLLYLSSLYNIYMYGFKKERYIELVISLSLALFAWNLPGLVLIFYLTIPIIIVYIITLSLQRLVELVKILLKSIILTVLMFMPFIYMKIVGVLSEGIFNYALRTGYIPSTENWIKILMPAYFEIYLGNLLKLLSIFIDPLHENMLTIFFTLVFIIVITTYIFKEENDKSLKPFFLSNLVYVLILYQLIIAITKRATIVNMLYNNIVILSVLKTVTNYMIILAPSIFIMYVISIIKLKHRMLKYIIALILVMIALFSHNGLIFTLYNLDNINSVTIGGINYNIVKIPHDIISLFNRINSERVWNYRILWLPLYREERSAFSSVLEDLPISKASDRPLTKYYDMLLRSLLSEGDNYISDYLLRMFGVRNIVLLKNINDTCSPSVVYFGYSPVGIEGDYRVIRKILDKKAILKLIENNKFYTLYEYYRKVSFFNLIRVEKNYTIFNLLNNINNNKSKIENICTINIFINNKLFRNISFSDIKCKKYKDYYFIKLSPTGNVSFKLDDEIIKKIGKSQNFIIDFTLVHYGTNTLYGNIINIGGVVRALIRPNGQLLIQYYTPEGYINHFSKTKLIPGQVYAVTIFMNGTHGLLFIDGILDSIVIINDKFVIKNNNIIIGFDGTYQYKGYIGNIDIIINTMYNFNISEHIKKKLRFLYFNFEFEDANITSICFKPYECEIRINEANAYSNFTIIVPFKLNNYWNVETLGCSFSKISNFNGISIITLGNCSNYYIIVRLGINKEYINARYLTIIISIIAIIYFINKLIGLINNPNLVNRR